jgi:hypothetical protein
MKRLWLLTLAAAASQFATAQRATYTVPETGQVITLSFHSEAPNKNIFDSIDITSTDKHVHFIPKYGVARIPATADERKSGGFRVNIPGLKLHPSRYFLTGKYGTDPDVHSLLFFVGQAGASDAAPTFVLGFSETGEPYKVLERDYLDVTSFQSTLDGTALIIGKETLSQVMGGDGYNGSTKPYATTYDPFSVFTVRPENKAAYSLVESRTYNQNHYVWAGPKAREDYAVLYNLPRHPKPQGAPASRVESLLGPGKVPVQ